MQNTSWDLVLYSHVENYQNTPFLVNFFSTLQGYFGNSYKTWGAGGGRVFLCKYPNFGGCPHIWLWLWRTRSKTTTELSASPLLSFLLLANSDARATKGSIFIGIDLATTPLSCHYRRLFHQKPSQNHPPGECCYSPHLPLRRKIPLGLFFPQRRLNLFWYFQKPISNWREYMNLNSWVVRDYYNLVLLVNSFEPHMEKLSNEQVCLFSSIILSYFTYLI